MVCCARVMLATWGAAIDSRCIAIGDDLTIRGTGIGLFLALCGSVGDDYVLCSVKGATWKSWAAREALG